MGLSFILFFLLVLLSFSFSFPLSLGMNMPSGWAKASFRVRSRARLASHLNSKNRMLYWTLATRTDQSGKVGINCNGSGCGHCKQHFCYFR